VLLILYLKHSDQAPDRLEKENNLLLSTKQAILSDQERPLLWHSQGSNVSRLRAHHTTLSQTTLQKKRKEVKEKNLSPPLQRKMEGISCTSFLPSLIISPATLLHSESLTISCPLAIAQESTNPDFKSLSLLLIL
jgi:hypothetical protein